MGREERLASARDAERALELGAHGDDRAVAGEERQRARCVPARTPDRKARAHDGVFAAAVDRPVVCEEGVGDPAQPRPSVVVVERDRLVRDVSARQHERAADVGREQVVQRRVREHDAEPRRPRRDRRRRPPRRPAAARARPAARASGAASIRRPRPRTARPAPRSSRRTAFPRDACARATARPPPRSRRRTRGGSRRDP